MNQCLRILLNKHHLHQLRSDPESYQLVHLLLRLRLYRVKVSTLPQMIILMDLLFKVEEEA
jgi:hypothetical protein